MHTKEKTEIQQKQTWKKDDECPSFYSNLMQVGSTPFDITVMFGEVVSANPKEVICAPQAKIHMAPEQAANLIHMLMLAVQGYVKQFGPLRPTAVLQAQINKEKKIEDTP